MDVIIWSDDQGAVVAYTPPGGMDVAEAARSEAVPKDRAHFIVDNGDLPDSKYFLGWRLGSDGAVTIDPAMKTAIDDPVPPTASAGDFMRALIELGWYGDVADAVAVLAAGGTEEGLLARVLWERAATFERHHPLVSAIAQAIGKDEAGLDLLFRRTRIYR